MYEYGLLQFSETNCASQMLNKWDGGSGTTSGLYSAQFEFESRLQTPIILPKILLDFPQSSKTKSVTVPSN